MLEENRLIIGYRCISTAAKAMTFLLIYRGGESTRCHLVKDLQEAVRSVPMKLDLGWRLRKWEQSGNCQEGTQVLRMYELRKKFKRQKEPKPQGPLDPGGLIRAP